MSENVVQPGIEPGSPDYRSDEVILIAENVCKQCLPGASHYKALKLTRSMRGWFSGRVVKASDR